MEYKEIRVSELKENPKNSKYFRDISEESDKNWNGFVENVRLFGILEPLLVRQDLMAVTSGHQRLKAAIEIGKDTVPCVLYNPETDQEDEVKLLSTNIFRRKEPDFFVYAEYVKIVRAGYNQYQRKETDIPAGSSIEDAAEEIDKTKPFVSAIDTYNTWPDEEKETFRMWYESQEQKPTDKAIQDEIKRLQEDIVLQGKTNLELAEELGIRKSAIDELKAKAKKEKKNYNDELIKLRKEKNVIQKELNKEKKKTKEERTIGELLSDAGKLLKNTGGLSADIAKFLGRLKKFDEYAFFQGLDVVELKDKLYQLKLNATKLEEKCGRMNIVEVKSIEGVE